MVKSAYFKGLLDVLYSIVKSKRLFAQLSEVKIVFRL